MAVESPDAKLLLYEKGMVPEDEPLLELEVKIDFEMDKINNPDASIGVCCSHKVIALGFNTLCYDAERRGIKPSARIKRFIDFTSIDVYPLIKLKDTVYSPDQLSLLNIQMGDVQYE